MNPDETSPSGASGPPGGAELSLVRLLDPDCVVLKLESTTKIDVLRELASLLVAGQPREVQEAVVAALIQREEVGSTGIGDGVAIPHARTPAVKEICMAAGVSQEGLDFLSLDNRPVHLFFLILTPVTACGPHLKILAQLTRILRSAEIRQALRSASTAQEFCQILRSAAGETLERRS